MDGNGADGVVDAKAPLEDGVFTRTNVRRLFQRRTLTTACLYFPMLRDTTPAAANKPSSIQRVELGIGTGGGAAVTVICTKDVTVSCCASRTATITGYVPNVAGAVQVVEGALELESVPLADVHV